MILSGTLDWSEPQGTTDWSAEPAVGSWGADAGAAAAPSGWD